MHFETITEVGNRLRSGEVTSIAITEKILERIEEQNAVLNAYITITAELAREQAKQADSD